MAHNWLVISKGPGPLQWFTTFMNQLAGNFCHSQSHEIEFEVKDEFGQVLGTIHPEPKAIGLIDGYGSSVVAFRATLGRIAPTGETNEARIHSLERLATNGFYEYRSHSVRGWYNPTERYGWVEFTDDWELPCEVVHFGPGREEPHKHQKRYTTAREMKMAT